MRIPFRILVLGAVLGLTAGTAPAQSYTTKVVARNLQRPTGVSVALDGKVYFTQLPTPGVPGTRGGTNTVNVLNPKNGRIRTLTTGEPEPTNLATTFSGDVYWTCKSANVILTLEDGGPKLVAGELDAPTGLAAYPFGALLFFTEVPTPAVGGGNGGRNKVYAFLESANREVLLDEGDPEPNDVAVDLLGNVYWSCSSAGVIVRLSGGKTDVIARGLRRPTGLATDYLGNLYL